MPVCENTSPHAAHAGCDGKAVHDYTEPDPHNDQRMCGVHKMHAADCFDLHYPNSNDKAGLIADRDARLAAKAPLGEAE